MSRRYTVTCSSCKFYDYPIYYVGSAYLHTKGCHIKHTCSCSCLREKEKVKEKSVRNEVDSLRGMRNKNKYNSLDDKLKYLKSELSSLIGEGDQIEERIESGESNDIIDPRRKIRPKIKKVHKSCEGNVSFGGGRVDVNPELGIRKPFRPVKKEFVTWLDSTIDSLDGKGKSDDNKNKNIPASKTKIPETLVEEDAEVIVAADYANKDLKVVQELLYESFVVQNYPSYTPGSDDSVQEVIVQPMNLSKRKHEKAEEGRRPLVKKTKTSNQKQRCESKREANHTTKPLNNDVEVIDIDDDSNNPVNNQVDSNEDKEEVILIKDSGPTPEKRSVKKDKSKSKGGVWECPICFEQSTGQEVVTTMCGHVFCKGCLEDYHVTHSQICPTCRTDLLDKPIITLFNF